MAVLPREVDRGRKEHQRPLVCIQFRPGQGAGPRQSSPWNHLRNNLHAHLSWAEFPFFLPPPLTCSCFNTWKARSSCRRSSPHLTMTDRSRQLGRWP